MKLIVADSSTLIALLDTDNFSLLFALFEELIISDEVYHEITHKFNHRTKINAYLAENRLRLSTAEHKEMYEMLIKRLDKGEAESITLAKNLELPLIIDEKKGRSIAKSLEIDIIGLIGIILKLLEKNTIDKAKALEIIEQLEASDFRLSQGLRELVYEY